MITIRKFTMLFAIGACFSLQSFAVDQDQRLVDDQAQTQVLELDAADVSVLRLTSVDAEAKLNSGETHQETTLGRAGLAGACVPPCGNLICATEGG